MRTIKYEACFYRCFALVMACPCLPCRTCLRAWSSLLPSCPWGTRTVATLESLPGGTRCITPELAASTGRWNLGSQQCSASAQQDLWPSDSEVLCGKRLLHPNIMGRCIMDHNGISPTFGLQSLTNWIIKNCAHACHTNMSNCSITLNSHCIEAADPLHLWEQTADDYCKKCASGPHREQCMPRQCSMQSIFDCQETQRTWNAWNT